MPKARQKAAPLVPTSAPDNRRPMVYSFSPANRSQKKACKLWEDGCRILFLLGGAGTGKTFLALALALGEAKAGRIKTIHVTRPLVEAGEELGFLPGEVDDKIGPFLVPVQQATKKLAYNIPLGLIEPVPLALMRGLNFDSAVAVLDEAQNATFAQLEMFISRMAKDSRIIISGDPFQSDLPGQRSYTDLERVIDRLEDLEGVGVVEFSDSENLRDPYLVNVLKRLRS